MLVMGPGRRLWRLLDVLELDAFNLPARLIMIRSLLQLGDKNRAKAEADIYQSLLPSEEREAFRGWMDRQKG